VDQPSKDVKVGSVFIRKENDTTILIEQVDGDRAVVRYIVCDDHNARLLGMRDWAFVVGLTDNPAWERIA